ncbi:SLBB domain-containing protein [Vibrio metschnikovii]|nr:SLBB domain-containing protein [Vibrio metschnikovii]EKO3721517.1 SLBB domain-containing protein [Vibrio metschnikovii]EKO3762838.1 SLBB domain-containing protein [Vibrio metschnikovii]
MFKGRFTLFAPLLLSVLAASAYAQSPTPEQLRMFQNLPASQQQALAKQYGISLPNGNGQATAQPLENIEIHTPRPELSAVKATQFSQQADDTKPDIKRFGVKLFASSPSTFAPTSDAPVPSDYPIGPGDEIVVQLFGNENSTHRLRVNREGVINFPKLGPISVAGLSFSQVRTSLSQRVQEQMIGVRSDITLGELRSMQIFVMGDAYKPGAYTVSALTTISQAIYYSGGFSDSGALRNVQLKRNGQLITTLDLYDLLLKGDTSNDQRLMPGDVVWISPVTQTVTVKGQVQRPAIYEIKPGETYQDVLALAGGFTANAFVQQGQVKRPESRADQAQIRTLDFSQTQALRQPVQNGDVLTIAERANPLTHYIELKGAVTHAGNLQWREGMRVSEVFHSLDSSFKPDVDLTYALIVREVNPQRDIRVLQFNPADALLNPKGNENLTLTNRDQILIFSRDGAETDEGTSEDVVQSVEQAQLVAEQERQTINQLLTIETEQQNKLASQQDKQPSFSRSELLAPVLLQLQQQARYGQPAPIADLIGEVRYPGRYPISQQQDLASLLTAAGGLTANAYSARAELTRAAINQASQRASIEQIDISAVLNGQQQVTIQPRDRLSVFERPDVRLQSTITLQGEVRFPGNYTVLPGDTLAQVIERAGGLTEFAHPQGAIFTREALRLQEQKLLTQYAADMRREVAKKSFNADSRVSSVISNPDKTLAFIEEATKSRALGRMVVQLDEVIAGQPSANFMLEDGDFLYVPKFRNTISIMGEVQVGITYLLDPSLTVKDYINRAGGIKKQADEGRIFVVRADGSVFTPNTSFWFGRRNETLNPGDTIVVPVDTDYRDALNVWTAATQILYQTGVAVNALK